MKATQLEQLGRRVAQPDLAAVPARGELEPRERVDRDRVGRRRRSRRTARRRRRSRSSSAQTRSQSPGRSARAIGPSMAKAIVLRRCERPSRDRPAERAKLIGARPMSSAPARRSNPSTRPRHPRGRRPMTMDSRTRWLALIVLCLGDLMIVLDTTIVNVALPSIRDGSRLLRDVARLGRERLPAHLRRLPAARRPARRPLRPPAAVPDRHRALHARLARLRARRTRRSSSSRRGRCRASAARSSRPSRSR